MLKNDVGNVVLEKAVWYYKESGDEISWKGDFITFFAINSREAIVAVISENGLYIG